MNPVKWNNGFLSNVDSFFDDFFKAQFPALQRMSFAVKGKTIPAVNIREVDDQYELEVAAPGMDKKDFNISVENGVMTIAAEKETKSKKEEKGYTRQEFSYESFERSFTLPEGADDEKVKATYKEGILYITLSKKPIEKPHASKMIKIS